MLSIICIKNRPKKGKIKRMLSVMLFCDAAVAKSTFRQQHRFYLL
jgi:hypothetical protein